LTMFRPSLLNCHRGELNCYRRSQFICRGIATSSIVYRLPSVTQGHACDKRGQRNVHDPQSEAIEKGRKDRDNTKGQEPKDKSETKKPNAGIGLQVS